MLIGEKFNCVGSVKLIRYFTQILRVEGDQVLSLQHSVVVFVDHAEDLFFSVCFSRIGRKYKLSRIFPFAQEDISVIV